MNRSQALKEAVKRWGNTACVQDRGAKLASTPESREAARTILRSINALPDAEKKARRKERDEALCAMYRFRYNVGTLAMGIAFGVNGSGDTWEEAFYEADNRYKTKAA